MTWPTQFGSLLGGNQPLSLIDGMFQQTAQMIEVPCSASGATAISLTPLVNCPVLTGYTEFCAARFRAAANSGAGVTAQVNGLGFLPVYKADGVTQAAANDLVIGFEYVVRFSQALGGGVGGWFLEAPAVGSGGGGGGTGFSTPGGRLTLTASVPVMTSSVSGAQQIFYVPYVSQFVQIWNGATLQPYNFCSSLGDTTGLHLDLLGSGNWPVNNVFDVFVTLNAGVPVLGTIQWSTVSTRAIGLSLFGGVLTNAAVANIRTGTTTTIPVSANQATFLGSFMTAFADGKCNFVFGAGAAGGTAAHFGLCNYYNKVSFNTVVTDIGAPYTYTANVPRQARASAGNQITYLQSDSERTNLFLYNTITTFTAGNVVTGIGFNSTATFTIISIFGVSGGQTTSYSVNSTGLSVAAAMEQSDGTHAQTFDAGPFNSLSGIIWL